MFVSRGVCSKVARKDFTLEKAKTFFKSFEGGKVELSFKNEDLAQILITNEGKKNSFTGMFVKYLLDYTNILTGKMFSDFDDCITSLESLALLPKVVVIKGSGNDFCSGGDLNFVKEIADTEGGYWMNCYFGNVLNRLSQLPVLSVADIRGYCLGGGTEVAANCDMRIFHENAKFGVVQGKMGVIQTWNGAGKLMEIVGKKNAVKLLMMGIILKADEALEYGLADQIYDSEEDFNKFIGKISQNSREVIQNGKLMFNALNNCKYSKHSHPTDQHSIEIEYSTKLWGSKGHKVALANVVKHK
uniref:Enoyl-CoA hydratase/isomerase family protein n=1 Tax=Rhabditophanes sp. KR3021 TaxID=114890 RepID=A0AC35TWS2_9BILA